jgi:hypothetical protein
MYSNAAAVYRADLAGHVFETAAWEQGLIGSAALPVINVPTKDGQYPVFKKKEGKLLKNEVKPRAPYGAFPRGEMAYNQDTYACHEYGFEQAVDDSIAADSSRFFDAEVIATSQARRKVLLGAEIRAKDTLFSTTNFGTATNSATAYTVGNLATFDAALDVHAAIDRLISVGESANTVILPYNVATRIKASTKFQNRARGIGIASDTVLAIDEAAMAEVFGVQQVLIPRTNYDSAGEGSPSPRASSGQTPTSGWAMSAPGARLPACLAAARPSASPGRLTLAISPSRPTATRKSRATSFAPPSTSPRRS